MANKTLLFICALGLSVPALGQSVILSENFDNYDGTVSGIPPGFSISWNDTASNSKSFYFTSAFCGQACNAYKFGVDSASMITPVFSGPGSVSFYLKGNGSFKANTFNVFETSDGSTWNLIAQIDSIDPSAQTVNLPLSGNTIQLRFFFEKPTLGYNAGFDDLVIYGPTSVPHTDPLDGVSVFPSPATNTLYLDPGGRRLGVLQLRVFDLLGMEVRNEIVPDMRARYPVDVSALAGGMYLLRLKSENGESVRRFVVNR